MIPFIDLKAQFRRLENEIHGRLDAVLEHGRFIMGPEVGELEGRLAAFTRTKHAIGCASGTDALLMALMAQGVGPGDAVFTTPFTFIATGETLALLGATPIFVDVEKDTFNLDPDKLEETIQAFLDGDASHPSLPGGSEGLTPKGIMPVDLFGLCCDYDRINAIAEKHGLFVIEDAAQSFGAMYKGKPSCSLGDIGCTSFFPAKPLGCYGDGGAVFTDDDELAEIMLSIRIHGKGTHKYDNVRVGINGRLDTMQAAILLPKLDVFPEELERRQVVARAYYERLVSLAPRLTPPAEFPDMVSAWAQYTLVAEDTALKESLQAALKDEGIPTAVYYPLPLHLQTAFSSLGHKKGDMPVSEYFSERVFSLPMHPYLEEAEIDRICGVIAKAVK